MSLGLPQPIWYDNKVLPSRENYASDVEYDRAMQEYVQAYNGTEPAFAPPRTFEGPGGETWYAAGNTSQQGETRGEYDANLLNARMRGGSLDQMALMSRMQMRPEQMSAAYNAMREDGTPVLADPILTLMETYGMKPMSAPASTPPATPPGTTPTNPNAGPLESDGNYYFYDPFQNMWSLGNDESNGVETLFRMPDNWRESQDPNSKIFGLVWNSIYDDIWNDPNDSVAHLGTAQPGQWDVIGELEKLGWTRDQAIQWLTDIATSSGYTATSNPDGTLTISAPEGMSPHPANPGPPTPAFGSQPLPGSPGESGNFTPTPAPGGQNLMATPNTPGLHPTYQDAFAGRTMPYEVPDGRARGFVGSTPAAGGLSSLMDAVSAARGSSVVGADPRYPAWMQGFRSGSKNPNPPLSRVGGY